MMDRHSEYTDLLMRHRDMLWQLCLRYANGDRDRCADLFQEVSVALWNNLDKLRGDATPRVERVWVRWQARSVFSQITRRRKLSTVPMTDVIADRLADENSQSQKELLDSLMSVLSQEEKQLIQLYFEGYHGDEIGKRMGISRNTVYQRMRRAIIKMQRVALVLLAMLATSAIAVALVPQWRQFVFGEKNQEELPVDTIPERTDSLIAPSTMPQNSIPSVEVISKSQQEPLEHLPSLELSEILKELNSTEELPPPSLQDNDLTISINGNLLTITGAEGELVRVYDMNGTLVSAQTAGRICSINLFPNAGTINSAGYLSVVSRDDYILHIGNRPPLRIHLGL